MSHFNGGDIVAALGIIYTVVIGFALVVPVCDRPGKIYFIFLLAWSVPYSIGYACDKLDAAPYWVQWHLVDFSYEQWSTTLGVTVYAAAMKLMRRSYNQRNMLIAGGISLVIFTIATYAWEIAQGIFLSLGTGHGTDRADYYYFATGLLITVTPIIAFRRSVRIPAHANAQ